jgi:RNA polymerase-binding protein DksA
MTALNDDDLSSLRDALDQRAQELGREVRELDAERQENVRSEPGTHVDDLAEQGEQRTHEALRHAERERDFEELRAIEAARERMATGSYGECIDCGEDIPLERLKVQPTASRCVPCQERHELTHPPLPAVPLPPIAS